MKTFKEFLSEDRWYEDPQFNYGSNLLAFREKVKENEGFRSKVYKDSYGNPTIGYGTLIDDSFPKTIAKLFPDKPKNWARQLSKGKVEMTQDEAEKIMSHHTTNKFDEIRREIGPDIFDRLHNKIQTGLADEHYRGGIGGGKSPKTMDLIRQGKLKEAGKEFLDNEEYRKAKAPGSNSSGVGTRMDQLSNDMIQNAEYENTELPPAQKKP
jgi:GH24 family phage-related lysozyme (muramidase)